MSLTKTGSQQDENRTKGGSEDDSITFTFKMSRILHGRMMMEVKKRQAEYSKYNLTDWLRETVRLRLDGPPTLVAAQPQQISQAPVTNGQIPAGVGRGTVGAGFWEVWARESKRLEGEARDESFKEALEQRAATGLKLPNTWAKMNPNSRLAWLRSNDTGTGSQAQPDGW
jgi:hypothetical protein